MFSSFCTFLLPLFPYVLLQPNTLSKPFFFTYASCLFPGSLTHNQCLPFPFTFLFLTHLWSFCGFIFLVQKSEVLALVFCTASVPPLHVNVYLFICTHWQWYKLYIHMCVCIYMCTQCSKSELVNLVKRQSLGVILTVVDKLPALMQGFRLKVLITFLQCLLTIFFTPQNSPWCGRMESWEWFGLLHH